MHGSTDVHRPCPRARIDLSFPGTVAGTRVEVCRERARATAAKEPEPRSSPSESVISCVARFSDRSTTRIGVEDTRRGRRKEEAENRGARRARDFRGRRVNGR